MIVGKFRSNHPLMFVLLFAVAVVLWTDGFIFHNQTHLPEVNAAPLYGIIASFFNSYNLISVLLSFAFMLLQALMFNRIITDKNLVDRNSWLPALLYIVFMSTGFGIFGLQPVWFANFFLILALDKMFEVFKDESANIEIFNIGFFVSLASLFYLPALVFILLVIAALIIYFLLNIKEFFAALMGLILPWLFVALYYYWTDQFVEKVEALQTISFNINLLDFGITPFGWFSIGIIGLVAIISVIRIYLGAIGDKPIRIRKRFHVLLAYLLIAIVSVSIANKHSYIHFAVIFVPLSAIVASFFQENKKMLFNEIIFTLLILLSLVGKLSRLD